MHTIRFLAPLGTIFLTSPFCFGYGGGSAALPVECSETVSTRFCGIDPQTMVLDPDGAVLTLVDTRIPPTGASYWPTAGQLWNPPIFSNFGAGTNEWTARNLGIVFGVALSPGLDPDIYVSASPGVFGYFDPAIPGVIGPAGSGGIYKIDGTSGQISNFVQTGFGANKMPNLGPGLGNIHVGSSHVYATNLDDGKIYTLTSSGNVVQSYDPFGANQNVDGSYATLGERTFAVAMNPSGTRLYFSVWLRDQTRTSTSWPATTGPPPANPNNSIWSVSIDATGSLIGSPQREIVLPYLPSQQWSNPVTDISFSPTGTMLLAERIFLGDYGQIDVGHRARILEYEKIGASWLPSSRNWDLGSTVFSGIAPNAVGGVASDDDSHTWATCDQIYPGGIYGLTRLPFPGNFLAIRITSSIPITLPGVQKNSMGELDCMNCNDPEVVGACCVTDPFGIDYCVIVTQQECYTTYTGIYYGNGSDCVNIDCAYPPEIGACCFEDSGTGWQCQDNMLEPDCLAKANSTWYINSACAQIICPPQVIEGACCFEDNCEWICLYTTESECLNMYQGTFYLNLPCSDIACPIETMGACCYEVNGQVICDFMSVYDCEELLGAFHATKTCDCIPCDPLPATGACCYMNSSGIMTCGILEAGPCATLSGVYFGDGSVCSNVICCAPIGACCIEGLCLLASSAQCANGNGIYYGNGTLCQNVQCIVCFADIDKNGRVDIDDLLILIGAMGVCP